MPGGNAAASSSVPRSTAAGSSRVTVLKTTGLSVAENFLFFFGLSVPFGELPRLINFQVMLLQLVIIFPWPAVQSSTTKKSETNNIKYHQKDLLIITTIGILAWIPEACEAWGVSRYKPPQSRVPSLELLNGSFYINMWYDSSCRCYALRLLNQSSFGIFKVSFICRSVYHPACTLRSFPVSSTTSFRTCRLHSSCRRLCLGVM